MARSVHKAARKSTGVAPPPPTRIESVKVTNYRALRSIHLQDLTPLTVLLGPNGSGKSTIFDVFSFLSECFGEGGLRQAWEKRGRFKELRTRGATGPITFELTYREEPKESAATYHLEIDEKNGAPVVAQEWLQWRRVAKTKPGAPYKILSFKNSGGWVISGERPDKNDTKVHEKLDQPDVLAVSTLGRLRGNARVAALRRFVTNWYVSYLSAADARAQPDAGAQEHLDKTGHNLANVIQYLGERHPRTLDEIFVTLRTRVPQIQDVTSEPQRDGKLLLLVKDAPFDEPVLARFASDGTLKMLSYLVVLHDPEPHPFVGIEEPENYLHPRLLEGLGEECRGASSRSQLLVTTHSPFFLNAVKPEEVRVLYRDDQGFTQAKRATDMRGVPEFMAHGAKLGQLWMEGQFGVGDPLVRSGKPRHGE
jgi:predicted ATPase